MCSLSIIFFLELGRFEGHTCGNRVGLSATSTRFVALREFLPPSESVFSSFICFLFFVGGSSVMTGFLPSDDLFFCEL